MNAFGYMLHGTKLDDSMGEEKPRGTGLSDDNSVPVVELEGDKLPTLSDDGKYGVVDKARSKGITFSSPAF